MNEISEKKNSVSLKGKVALVTGAASGIGKGIAIRLANFGCNVLILDIDEVNGKETAAHIKDSDGYAEFRSCDVTSSSSCKGAVDFARRELGGVDILVNNAGIIRRKSILQLDENEWDEVLAVNLKSVYLLSRHAIPIMENRGGGSIVNISSGWGLKGGPKAAAYCASKAGLVNLTRAMAIDHGGNNIRVNCVCPGDTDTDLLRGEAKQLGADEDVFLREASDRPLGRLGTPEDVAGAVIYLASELADWVTGTTLVVDGGGLA